MPSARNRARQFLRRIAHISGRIGHHTETLVGHIQQAGGEQHTDPALPTRLSESAGIGLGQAAHHECGQDRQLDGDNDQFGASDEGGADHVDDHHRHNQTDPDGFRRPAGRLPRQQVADVSGETRAIQRHRDDPAEELKHVEAAGDHPVAEAADEELRSPATARITRAELCVGVHAEHRHRPADQKRQMRHLVKQRSGVPRRHGTRRPKCRTPYTRQEAIARQARWSSQ
jgi:hypothetical protein